MASTSEPTTLKEEEGEDESRPPAADEDTGAQVAPIIQLQEAAVTIEEENDDLLLKLKAKLYRFDMEAYKWKKRGVGAVKLLKHKEKRLFRLVMRQKETFKCCANHLVLPTMSVREYQGNEKTCLWHAADFTDRKWKDEFFCIFFSSVEDCRSFKDKIGEIKESLADDSEEGDTAAELIEKLSVEGKDKEENTEAEEEHADEK